MQSGRGFESDDWKQVALSILTDVFAETVRRSSSAGGSGESAFSLASFFRTFAFGGGRARGGPVRGNVGYLVGENGPEFLVPGQHGFVQPLQGDLYRGAGRAPLNVTNNFNGTDFTLDFERNIPLFANPIAHSVANAAAQAERI